MSLKPEIKMDIFLGRSPAGGQALANSAFAVVPSVLPLRGQNMSLNMRLLVVSIEASDLGGSEYIAVGLSGPIG